MTKTPPQTANGIQQPRNNSWEMIHPTVSILNEEINKQAAWHTLLQHMPFHAKASNLCSLSPSDYHQTPLFTSTVHPVLSCITNSPPPMCMPDHNTHTPPPHLIRYNLRCRNASMCTRMACSLYRCDLVPSIEMIRYGGDGFVTIVSRISQPSAT